MKKMAMSMIGLAAFTMVAATSVQFVPEAAAKDKAATKVAAATDQWAAVSKLLPANVKFVFGISATKIKGLQVYQDFWKSMSNDQNVQMLTGMVQGACGLDPIAALENITIALDDNEKVAIFVQMAGIDEAKLTDCATKLIAQMGNVKVTAKKAGNLVEYTIEGEKKKMYIAWPTKNVFMFTSEPDDKALAQKFLGGKGKLAKDANFKAGLGTVKTGGLFWVVGTKLDDLGDSGEQYNGKYVAATIDTNSATELSVNGRIALASADEAKKLAAEGVKGLEEAKKEMGAMGTLLKNIVIGQSDKDVTITGTITLDKTLGTKLGEMIKQGM